MNSDRRIKMSQKIINPGYKGADLKKGHNHKIMVIIDPLLFLSIFGCRSDEPTNNKVNGGAGIDKKREWKGGCVCVCVCVEGVLPWRRY